MTTRTVQPFVPTVEYLLKPRERMLISGVPGAGKTEAMWSIIRAVLKDTDSQVFLLDSDMGSARVLAENKDNVVGMVHTAENPEGRLHYLVTSNWMLARTAYRYVKQNWTENSWIFIDRVDLFWEWVQDYFNSLREDVSEDDIDMLYMEKRAESRKEATELAQSMSQEDKKRATAIRNAITNKEMATLDWNLVKAAYNSIVYDVFAGSDATLTHVNVICTAVARPLTELPPDIARRPDPRRNSSLGITIQGEKHLEELVDSHVFLSKDPYAATTIKDRGRDYMAMSPIALESKPFLEVYCEGISKDIVTG